jgi:hypothetical protein
LGSYIVRTDRIVDVVGRMKQLAPEATWDVVEGASELLDGEFSHMKYFYYCDDKEGNTIRAYDPAFTEAMQKAGIWLTDHVILRGHKVGPRNGEVKGRIRGLFDDCVAGRLETDDQVRYSHFSQLNGRPDDSGSESPPTEDQDEFRKLFDQFSAEYLQTNEGRAHYESYSLARKEAQRNYRAIIEEQSDEVTDQILLWLLPYLDTESNREKGAWVHVASTVNADIRTWFENGKWAKPEDWPETADAILNFVTVAIDRPDDFPSTCSQFADSEYSKGFQSGMLSPILNALRPDLYLIANSKSQRVLNRYSGSNHAPSIRDYPETNKALRAFVDTRVCGLEVAEGDPTRAADLFDQFSHWLVSIEKHPLREPNYWKIAPGEKAHCWDQCRDEGMICVGWGDLGDLTGVSKGEFDGRLTRLMEEKDGWTRRGAEQAWTFSRIKEGDRIVANRGASEVLGIGTVTGSYYYAEGQDYSHRLAVEWDDLTPRQVDRVWRRTLVKLTKEDFHQILVAPTKGGSSGNGGGGDEPNPVYTLEECSTESGFEVDVLDRWVRAIHRKGQAVFYGPPGTGKTYIAQLLAKHLVGGGDGFISLVQFHPSYAYEDFIQGIRPQTKDGKLSYPLMRGRFLDFCAEAEERSGTCVLIIDEINRANLSRVFGELMYLLEYRSAEVPLAAGESFTIPENVRLIGTMNTADRSIALVDHALRRRFAFLQLRPDMAILDHYHNKNGTGFDTSGLVVALQSVNAQIGDPHYEIGISYFLRKDIAICMQDVWEMEIEPYLDEFFYDQPDKVMAFRWNTIGSSILT